MSASRTGAEAGRRDGREHRKKSAPAHPSKSKTESKRLFLALPLPPDIRRILADYGVRYRGTQGVRPIPAERLHMTLLFLGNTPNKALPVIAGKARQIAKGLPCFDLELSGAGAFPSARRPRVIWVGTEEPTGSLAKLAHRLHARLAYLLPPRERKSCRFKAHITVCRVKTVFSGPIQPFSHKGVGFSVDTFCLFESILHPSGPEYHIVNTFRLNKGDER